MAVTKQSQQKLRIISGKWRGRKFPFPAIPGLRPTADRVRETLFNWLAPFIAGARCLDLFAGSGALGLEALSRGAAYVEFYDAAPIAATHIQQLLVLFAADNAKVYQLSVPKQLPMHLNPAPFDIVFLDPPFHQNLVEQCCHWLEDHHWLSNNAYIYIEIEAALAPPALPDTWRLLKQSHAGQVKFYLAQKLGSANSGP